VDFSLCEYNPLRYYLAQAFEVDLAARYSVLAVVFWVIGGGSLSFWAFGEVVIGWNHE
jgi:hypothetical protein